MSVYRTIGPTLVLLSNICLRYKPVLEGSHIGLCILWTMDDSQQN